MSGSLTPQLCDLRLGRSKNHLRERGDRVVQILIAKWLENPVIKPDIRESHLVGRGRQDERLDWDRWEKETGTQLVLTTIRHSAIN